MEQKSMHFVLVHGACHGAWCWYKLKPRLESAGHRVTALDLAASGIDTQTIEELTSLADYSRPLMELMAAIPPGEKVILVGHSLGGLNLALAMDHFPDKISLAVFLTAFMPDSVHRPSYVLEQKVSKEYWLDTQFLSYGTSEKPLTSMFFGPKFLRSNLYQLCSDEDYMLARMLSRPGSLFVEDLSKAKNFSSEGFGAVKKAYVVCTEDKGIWEEFQRWMIENGGAGIEVEVMNGADHMPMLSMTQELCNRLSQIAAKYASTT
ncbi:salicylic acid-binding protein 2-like isoform X2 [Malania oleifera]|uniref:salicylic acid-binding protein 2-like isoform X2 n=1 Tax=Malania oleifera TaxID=397392 RepID=UPI0025ADFF80|nr:salicylic acid-binding protein 2-like isoform X2 [Malania oleifera]